MKVPRLPGALHARTYARAEISSGMGVRPAAFIAPRSTTIDPTATPLEKLGLTRVEKNVRHQPLWFRTESNRAFREW